MRMKPKDVKKMIKRISTWRPEEKLVKVDIDLSNETYKKLQTLAKRYKCTPEELAVVICKNYIQEK